MANLENILSQLNSFIINQGEKTLAEKLKKNFSSNSTKYIDILVAYFKMSGFNLVAKELSNENIKKIRLLVGIKTEKQVLDFIELVKELQDEIDNNNEENVKIFLDLLKSKKLEIKATPYNDNHSKFYICRNENPPYQNLEGRLIVGSSNFTANGLKYNFETNIETREERNLQEGTTLFNALWEEAVELSQKDIEEKIIKKLKNFNYKSTSKTSPINTPFYFILTKYFEDIVDVNLNIDSEIKLFDYQKDAVNSALLKLNRYNGTILGDVVGLGKTVMAAAIVKKLNYKTLVIAPPSVHNQWKKTFKSFNIKNFKIVSYDKLPKESNEGLIIIDESHRLKDHNTTRYEKIQELCKFPFRKKVLLLSATLQNNSPQDIENQIYLFQDKNHSNLPNIVSLEKFFAPLNKEFRDIKREINHGTIDKETLNERIKEISQKIKKNILKHILIRRTRTDILQHPMYKKDIQKFPTITNIKHINYNLNELSDIYEETLEIISKKITYERFRILNNLNEKGKAKYKSQNPHISDNIFQDNDLSTLAKYNFVKRFESSFGAFKKSLNNSIIALEQFIKNLEKDRLYVGEKSKEVLEDTGFEKYIYDEKANAIYYIDTKTKQKIYLKGIIVTKSDLKNPDEYIKGLKKDLKYLKYLQNLWKNITKDPKLNKLKETLKEFKNKKIVIFTEYSDTLNYLQEKLNLKNTLFIDSTNRQENEEIIYKNFDANCPKDEQENRYDILITTDTLAEGVNLHRSDTLINYDLPWNSTRLMQRLGRINRIGTQFDKLNIYSFMPVNKSNEVIKIEEKSYLKLQSFHHTLGEDSKILFNDEEISSFGIEDEVDEELIYLQKLRDFKEKYPDEFEKLKKQTELSVCIPKKENKELFYFKLGKTSYFFEKEKEFKFIDFLEFIKHLENIENFKNIPSKADEAIEFYKTKIEVENFINNNLKKTLTKTEKEAIYLIQNWYKKDIIDKLTKERLIELIQNKTLKTLAQQILKLKDKSEKEIEQETKKFLKSTSKTAEEKISAKAYIKLEEKC